MSTITLRGKPYTLRLNLRARYRQQTLAKPSTFADLSDPTKATAALLNFAWACLPAEAAVASPEALADMLDEMPDGITQLDDSFSSAIRQAYPTGKDADEKKA